MAHVEARHALPSQVQRDLRGVFEDDTRLAQHTVRLDQWQGHGATRDMVQGLPEGLSRGRRGYGMDASSHLDRCRAGLTRGTAMTFVILPGIVSLFADMTYEGARSITGPYLAVLGASAAVVGVVAGFGELIGYLLRLVAGYLSDRTGRYWLFTLGGYVINLLAVPRHGAAHSHDGRAMAPGGDAVVRGTGAASALAGAQWPCRLHPYPAVDHTHRTWGDPCDVSDRFAKHVAEVCRL